MTELENYHLATPNKLVDLGKERKSRIMDLLTKKHTTFIKRKSTFIKRKKAKPECDQAVHIQLPIY